MTTQDIDQAATEAFAGQMIAMLNGASLALLTSIGHQTGLFDTMAGLPPATSEQIADAAGLNERYVREWLGGMTVGRIVVYDPATRTYRLPPEHAAALTRAAGPGNLASFAQFIPLLAEVEQGIVTSFREGGGVPYSAYPRFQGLMAENSAQVRDVTLLDVTLPLIPGLPDQLRMGIDVADVGCGSGHAINLMARAFPASRFTGYDFSDGAIAAARAEAHDWGLANATFVLQDVAALDARDAYDLITVFDAIHDQAQPGKVLRNIATALRSDGTFLMVDIAASSNLEDNIDHPAGPFLYAVSVSHCMTVSLALGGEGLGTAWGEQKALQMLADAGFTGIEIKRVESDPFNNYYIARK
jgi:SAM-dependent methyltransferase